MQRAKHTDTVHLVGQREVRMQGGGPARSEEGRRVGGREQGRVGEGWREQ